MSYGPALPESIWLKLYKNSISFFQNNHHTRCFFSGRSQSIISPDLVDEDEPSSNGHSSTSESKLVSVAGVGTAVFFQQSEPFSFDDWKCIRRFLSEDSPLIRAYGALRFDPKTSVSSEWKDFGSFYFMVPLVILYRSGLVMAAATFVIGGSTAFLPDDFLLTNVLKQNLDVLYALGAGGLGLLLFLIHIYVTEIKRTPINHKTRTLTIDHKTVKAQIWDTAG